MIKYPPNFPQREFACKCGCGFDAINPVIPMVCQDIRDYINSFPGYAKMKIIVTSGCRCPKRNEEVGSKSVNHTNGNAADLQCAPGHIFLWDKIKELYDLKKANPTADHRLILALKLVLLEGSWVHIDVDRDRSNGVFQKL